MIFAGELAKSLRAITITMQAVALPLLIENAP